MFPASLRTPTRGGCRLSMTSPSASASASVMTAALRLRRLRPPPGSPTYSASRSERMFSSNASSVSPRSGIADDTRSRSAHRSAWAAFRPVSGATSSSNASRARRCTAWTRSRLRASCAWTSAMTPHRRDGPPRLERPDHRRQFERRETRRLRDARHVLGPGQHRRDDPPALRVVDPVAVHWQAVHAPGGGARFWPHERCARAPPSIRNTPPLHGQHLPRRSKSYDAISRVAACARRSPHPSLFNGFCLIFVRPLGCHTLAARGQGVPAAAHLDAKPSRCGTRPRLKIVLL